MRCQYAFIKKKHGKKQGYDYQIVILKNYIIVIYIYKEFS